MTPRSRIAAGLTAGSLVLAAVSACGSTAPHRVPASRHRPGPSTTVAFRPVGVSAPGTAAGFVADGAVTGPAGGGVSGRLFSPLSPWNTPADELPVDPRSARMLALATQRDDFVQLPDSQTIATRVRSDDAGLFINTSAWTVPIVTDQHGVPTKVFCRQVDCGPYAVGLSTLMIPRNVNPDPRYDGWFSVIDRRDGVGYDLWRARRQADGSISYQFVKRWQLDGPGYSQPIGVDPADAVGARGSGLPLFAGVILPAELRAGRIDHALAISVPGPAATNFVAPASATDGIGAPDSLPEGARIRLRRGVRLGPLPPGDSPRSARAILTALRVYGAIVVDRAKVPTLYAQAGLDPTMLQGNELQGLHLDDFVVVALPPLLQDPPPLHSGADAGATAGVTTPTGAGQ